MTDLELFLTSFFGAFFGAGVFLALGLIGLAVLHMRSQRRIAAQVEAARADVERAAARTVNAVASAAASMGEAPDVTKN